jgi:cytoskeletal protein CcmA (bactofilin family)
MSGWVTLSTKRPASRQPTPVPAPTEHGNGSGGERNSVVLGPKDRLVGQLFIEGDLRVSGTVEGALEATGDITIAGAGKVSGQVTAYNRLVVGGDASLIGGDVRVARLTVEDGATFTGKVSMGKNTMDQTAVQAPKPPVDVPAPEPVVAIKAEPEPQPVPEPEPVKAPKRADILKALQPKGKRR